MILVLYNIVFIARHGDLVQFLPASSSLS